MNMENETKQLIKQFSSKPGVESEQFDCKSKEIVESSSGRKKLVKVLSAMANQSGGTVIVGVRKQSNELLIQGFSVDSEVVQHINHTAVEYTVPPITDLLRTNFVEYSGKNLLRIDVEQAKEKPIQYKEEGEYVPWIRVGDGMEEMTRSQMLSFFESRKREKHSLFSSEVEERVNIHLDSDSDRETHSIQSPQNWLITTTEGRSMFVFGEPGLSHDFGKSVLYHVEERVYASTAEEIEHVFDVLENTTGTKLSHSRVGYTIELGERQEIGRGYRWFVEDLKNIENTIGTLEEAHKVEPISDPPSDPQPIAVAYVSCSAGLFWLETQWDGEEFTRTRCGFVFTDIPFNEGGYQSFFTEIGRSPDIYEQRRGLQILTLAGDSQYLGRPQVVDISDHVDSPEYMVVDNPYYHRTDELKKQSEVDIPEYFLDPLDGINRIPLNISGGYKNDRSRSVELDTLTLFSKDLLMNTIFASGWCRQKRE